jgi:hypothetical protein
MQILDNINALWGDDLKKTVKPGAKLKIAASCFSIYAYEALKKELEQIESLEFIFTAQAFVPNEVTDKVSRERREFHIPKQQRERSLYGSEFEIQLKNKLTQRAYEGESQNLSTKLRTEKSVEEIFRHAQTVFNWWSKLPAEERTAQAILNALDFDFFELLDSVTIARSRKHIETFYDTTDIGKFPVRRKPLSFRCPLTMRGDVIGFNEIYKQLSLLKLSVYAPVSYILPSRLRKYEELYDTAVEGGKGTLRQADREKSLQSLMTTNLLKRLESSVESFRLTLGSLEKNHLHMLSQIEQFRQSGADFSIHDPADSLGDLEAEDDDLTGLGDFMIGGKVQVSLADMDLPSWEYDLKADVAIITELLNEMKKVGPNDDSKLQHLKKHVVDKINSPINHLEMGVHTGRVTGKDTPKTTLKKGFDFQSILTLFSPISKEKALILPEEQGEIDVLIGTDCISEGQNLQDCDYLINYDIHWNPVRIIQRFGRIDRIGSTNESIQLVNYWPDISLDEYINLKERVENRMIIADVTATGDDNVLSAQANDVSYRKEQLRRLQDEVIELEDLKTGVNITDLGLNDFRMDLLNYIKANGELGHLPHGLHAIIPANKEMGLTPGVIFTLRNRNSGVNINQHNRLNPYYLIYISDNGQVIADHTQVKSLLDLVRTSCKGLAIPLQELCKKFNIITRDGRDMDQYSDLLGQAIRSMVEVKEDEDIDSLFTGRSTTALVDTIKGLDDFELISFLIVREEAP